MVNELQNNMFLNIYIQTDLTIVITFVLQSLFMYIQHIYSIVLLQSKEIHVKTYGIKYFSEVH